MPIFLVTLEPEAAPPPPQACTFTVEAVDAQAARDFAAQQNPGWVAVEAVEQP